MPGIAVSRQDAVEHPNSVPVLGRPSHRLIRIAIATTAVAWVPVLMLSALGGFNTLRGFLLDYAAQSRLLMVIGILIIAEPELVKRLELIVRHFLEDKLIKDEDRPRFESALARFNRAGDSLLAQAGLLTIGCAMSISALPYIEPGSFLPWAYGKGGIENLSPAGSWYLLVSSPIILYLLLRWIWRQLLWARFLHAVSRMDLQLIPAHPDRVAGLGFVETCCRKYLPFSFAVGTIAAGGIANRVLHENRSWADFRFIPILVMAIVISVSAGPFCVLFRTLLEAKRRGRYAYGALATAVGRQFEEKWLAVGKEGQAALEVQDFSATIDLYSVVANVDQMDFFPLKKRSLMRVAIWSIVPCLPIVIASLPFEEVVRRVLKLLV